MYRAALSSLDLSLGMRYYSTCTDGIGGFLKRHLSDFIVIELTPDQRPCLVLRGIGGGEGRYTWLVVLKRGVDSTTALRLIARSVGVDARRFSLAGLKDARAVTVQLACIEDVPPEKFSDVRLDGKVRILAAFRMPFKLATGMLYGNRFNVRIRNLAVTPDACAERLRLISDELEEKGGAPNYYGYQRFGTIRPVTHIIGKHILLGDFKSAVETLLQEVFPLESESAKKARLEYAATRDCVRVLPLFPRNLHHERRILRHLSSHPGDYIGGLRALPMSIRKLFVGAYQAYLFNLVLSKRMELGLSINRAVPGDYAAFNCSEKQILRVNESNAGKINEWIGLRRACLMLPVPGYGLSLGRTKLDEIVREVLKEEEITLDVFMCKNMPEVSSRGAFRPAALKPEKMLYSVVEDGVIFNFVLRKGMYGTVLLREYVKPADPAMQGF